MGYCPSIRERAAIENESFRIAVLSYCGALFLLRLVYCGAAVEELLRLPQAAAPVAAPFAAPVRTSAQ